MAKIEYFYSAHSAFAYLGSQTFMDIAKAAGRKIVHRPYDLRIGIPGVGSSDTRNRPPNHRAYYFGREIDRWAEYRDAPVIGGIPKYHHNDPALANGMLIVAQDQGLAVDALANRMLEAHWREDADLADRATLAQICDAVGVAADPLLKAADDPAVAAAYKANTEEAIARSVFGSPTYFVDGDMFYGQDRLELVARALKQPFKGDWPAK
jgi:2-hydroxychromene-2-carboxylate isomerase